MEKKGGLLETASHVPARAPSPEELKLAIISIQPPRAPRNQAIWAAITLAHPTPTCWATTHKDSQWCCGGRQGPWGVSDGGKATGYSLQSAIACH